jgi:hypothetical protein
MGGMVLALSSLRAPGCDLVELLEIFPNAAIRHT